MVGSRVRGSPLILAGHPGSGRDRRRGDRTSRVAREDDLPTISAGQVHAPFWCCHQLPLGSHACLAYENDLRAQRGAPCLSAT